MKDKPRATSGYKSIQRIDQPERSNHGYQVRVAHKKMLYTKFFTDKAHGGAAAALCSAVAYRDELEAKLGKQRSEKTVHSSWLQPKSNTGFRGVYRGVQRSRGHYSDSFFARWYDEHGKMVSRCFSIRKHGEVKAFELAKQARIEFERANVHKT